MAAAMAPPFPFVMLYWREFLSSRKDHSADLKNLKKYSISSFSISP